MLNEKRTGQDILDEYNRNGVMDVNYGVVRDDDLYGLLQTFSDTFSDGVFHEEDSPLFIKAMSIIEKLAREDDIGGLVISKRDYDHEGFTFEIWKNLTLAKSQERQAV